MNQKVQKTKSNNYDQRQQCYHYETKTKKNRQIVKKKEWEERISSEKDNERNETLVYERGLLTKGLKMFAD